MSLITLDFETPYRSRKDKGTPGEKYTLKSLTYEQYLRDPRFRVMGLGLKVDDGPTQFYRYGQHIKSALERYFYPGNTNIMVAHNTAFDGAILSWHYGLGAFRYWDTQGMSNGLWPGASASLDALTKRLFPNDPSKWKGKELVEFDGLWPEDMTEELWETYAGYGAQDVDITFAAFCEMWKYYPGEELDIIDMTLKLFIHPGFELDTEQVEQYQQKLLEKKDRLVRESGLSESTLASNAKFARYLEEKHGITVPEILSPTQKNPHNTKLALAKGDLEFIELRKAHPELNHIWDARIAVKSTGELTRCARLLEHAHPETKRIAVPLKYYGAHTGRWSGTNKVNFQNFKRNSPLRYSLYAPKGFKILVRDLSNIEGRKNAWFNEQHDKCAKFAAGIDLYNDLATDIFGYPVDRKKKKQDANGNYLDHNDQIVTNKDDAAEEQFVEGFTGKTAELGLGYGMGPPKFRYTCAVQGDILFEEDFTRQVVKTWRNNNYKIVAGWRAGDRAIFDMASPNMTPYNWGCIRVERGRLILPNGMALVYPRLHYDESERGFIYWNGKFYKNLWGGTLMENIIQALSRITMSGMMLDIDRQLQTMGGRILLTVHDEIISQAPASHATEAMEHMTEVMATTPGWANDGHLALKSDGAIADNYSK